MGPRVGEISPLQRTVVLLEESLSKSCDPLQGVQKYNGMGHELRELVDLRKQYDTDRMATHLE